MVNSYSRNIKNKPYKLFVNQIVFYNTSSYYTMGNKLKQIIHNIPNYRIIKINSNKTVHLYDMDRHCIIRYVHINNCTILWRYNSHK